MERALLWMKKISHNFCCYCIWKEASSKRVKYFFMYIYLIAFWKKGNFNATTFHHQRCNNNYTTAWGRNHSAHACFHASPSQSLNDSDLSDLRVTALPAAKVHVNFLELCFTAQLISQSSAHWAISAEAKHTLTQVGREPWDPRHAAGFLLWLLMHVAIFTKAYFFQIWSYFNNLVNLS